ncbi:MAG: tetratricopeptide repeat protein [Flavobacteriaceae bacterium]|nr:tetratricopeptide repeat protein [Flavobacteriaceae bacterium]
MKNIDVVHYVIIFIVISFVGTIKLRAQEGLPLVQGDYIYYYPKLNINTQNFENIKKNLSEVLKSTGQIYDVKNKKEINAKDIKEILVLDDRIEVEARSKKNNLTLYFPKLIDSTMIFYTYQNSWHYVYFPSLVNFAFSDFSNAQTLANNIYAIQYSLIDKRRDSLINVFKPLAENYRSLKQKPSVSEEQRKLFIQADHLNQQKKYFDAIKMYLKAIQLDKTSFPSAYSNLALLYAQTNFFDYAIFYMKQYLMLVPNAEDARGAQDKIYAWEGLIGK